MVLPVSVLGSGAPPSAKPYSAETAPVGSCGDRDQWHSGPAGFRGYGPDGAAADRGRRREPTPCPGHGVRNVRRGDDEQRHHGHDKGTRDNRRRRVQPNDRPGHPGRRPYPVEAERDRQLRLRQRRAKAPARFLPQPPDHRPALAGRQPWKQVNRDAPRAALSRAVQPGHIAASGRKVLIANANHSTTRPRMPNPVRMRKARE
jgi:hypothetical protein